MNSFIERLYFSSPVFIQNIVVSAYGYVLYRQRYIGNHDYFLNELLKSQWYGEKEMQEVIERRFRAILHHAIRKVPFYKDLVKRSEIRIENIKGIADLEKLPIISKEEIREYPERFLAEDVGKKDLIVINTSGTSGKTLKIFVDKNSRRNGYAFFTRLQIWAGVHRKHKNVTFGGRTVVPPNASAPPFWRKNIILNNYLFSSYHLSPKNLKHYVEKLKEIQPHFIDSYPSSIYTIADFMKENSIDDIHPKAIITSSETLLDYQRRTIEQVFRCPIYDQYGSAEQVVFVSQCERGTYHIHPEFGIVEFLREDGSKAGPGEPARLICTGFTNVAMPLIRYDIGDLGVFSEKKCPCGRNFPVIENILGRTDDMVVTRDGRRVGRLDPVFKGLQSIKEAQIIQEDYDEIVVKIVPGKDYKEKDGDVVVNELKKRLGSQANVSIHIVDEIPRSSAGKFRAVISKVNR